MSLNHIVRGLLKKTQICQVNKTHTHTHAGILSPMLSHCHVTVTRCTSFPPRMIAVHVRRPQTCLKNAQVVTATQRWRVNLGEDTDLVLQAFFVRSNVTAKWKDANKKLNCKLMLQNYLA